MNDSRAIELAGDQFNRISRKQLGALGFGRSSIKHQLRTGHLVVVEDGVYAIPPVLDDSWGRWMGATLTAPRTRLSMESAACARGWLEFERPWVTVTRPGSGGPQFHGGLLVFRSRCIEPDEVNGVPTITAPMLLLDLAAHASDTAFARAVRNALRKDTSLIEMGDKLGEYRGRRAVRRLGRALASYAGIPIERARSGAEIRAMQLIRDAGIELPKLNVNVAGEEADLTWAKHRLIIEIDGEPWHLDKGADARKEAAWEGSGYTVRRIPSDDVYENPAQLLALSPSNVAQGSL